MMSNFNFQTARISDLFNLGYTYINAAATPKPSWKTVSLKYPLSASEFIKMYNDPLNFVGTSFGEETIYGMLDIDSNSPYHPENNKKAFDNLINAMQNAGLASPMIYRSSESGGLHIYYFLVEKVNTFRLSTLFYVTLKRAGFEIENGKLELFPHPKPFGRKGNFTQFKSHRAAGQFNSGGAFLDENLEPTMECDERSPAEVIEHFLKLAEKSANGQDLEKIRIQLNPLYEDYKATVTKYQNFGKQKYSARTLEWKNTIEATMVMGWTDHGETNKLLPEFVKYGIVFKGIENKQELYDWVYHEAISAQGYKQYCKHQHEIERRIWDWINATIDKGYYKPYRQHPTRDGNSPYKEIALKEGEKKPRKKNYQNAKTEKRTRERIIAVVEKIREEPDDIPVLIVDLLRRVQEISKKMFKQELNNRTLYKKHYKDLWQQLIRGKKQEEIVNLEILKNVSTNNYSEDQKNEIVNLEILQNISTIEFPEDPEDEIFNLEEFGSFLTFICTIQLKTKNQKFEDCTANTCTEKNQTKTEKSENVHSEAEMCRFRGFKVENSDSSVENEINDGLSNPVPTGVP